MDEDQKLLKKVRKNKSQFALVYSKYQKKIFNYINKRVSNREISEDLVSEIFEKAYNAIDDFKWQGISLSSWLFRIAKNLLTDYYRKKHKIGSNISLNEIEEIIEDDASSIYSDYIRDLEEKALFNSLREFNEYDQYLIFYKFFEGLSNKDIAKITGLAESNVGTRLYRIRAKLKDYLKNYKIFKK